MKSSWGISPETPDEAKAEQVRERTLGVRFEDRLQYRAIAGVKPPALLGPLPIGVIAMAQVAPSSTFQRSKFMRLTTPLLAVLNVLADTPQVHPRRDPSGSSIAREPIPDGITSVVYWMHHR